MKKQFLINSLTILTFFTSIYAEQSSLKCPIAQEAAALAWQKHAYTQYYHCLEKVQFYAKIDSAAASSLLKRCLKDYVQRIQFLRWKI